MVSLRPTTASLPWSSPKNNTKLGSATEESVLPPKTNNKTCISTMHFIIVLPLLFHRIPSPPTRRTERGHAGALQTFSLCRWGGNGLATRQNPHSFSLLPPEKDRVCHPAICNQSPASPRKKIASATGHGNEGAIGLTHRSCFRVAAAPTLATRGTTICRIILDDLLFLKARRQGRREDVKWHGYALVTCRGNEKHGPISLYLASSVREARQQHEH